MCVILIAEKRRPTAEQVEAAFEKNDSGAGIAFRKDGKVVWEKGLELERIKELCAEVPLPFIAHFRIPSGGFPKLDVLCHPFPVDKKVPLALKGSTTGAVLFHNGHWPRWKDAMLDLVSKTGVKIPVGKWTDSRAMAFIVSIMGYGYLELIDDQRTAIISPEGIDVTGIWCKIGDEDGLWASNRLWEKATNVHSNYAGGSYDHNISSHYCLVHNCHKIRTYNSTYCIEHKNTFDKIDRTNAASKPDTAVIDGEVVAGEKKEEKKEFGGTPAKIIPFVLAKKLFQEGKLSKKRYKKARKAYEKEQEKLSRQRMLKAEEEQRANPQVTLH